MEHVHYVRCRTIFRLGKLYFIVRASTHIRRAIQRVLSSLGSSHFLKVKGDTENSRFDGQWVSPFLLLGVYNKLVKIGGSGRVHNKR